ncbi:MAG: hypothetical protein AAFZ15_34895 [Bacteroidota bacterium]
MMKKLISLFHDVIFPRQLAFGVFFLNLFGDKKYGAQLKERIVKSDEGTVGFELNDFMHRNGLTFVPWYEKHDLKHAILGYGITPPEEMYMQAFMFGNAGFSPLITLITLSFLIWIPDAWRSLPYHFLVGKFTKPIGGLTVEGTVELDLKRLREDINLEEARQRAAFIINELAGNQKERKYAAFPLKK